MMVVFAVVPVVATKVTATAVAVAVANDNDDDGTMILIEIKVDRGGLIFVFVAAANVTTIDGDNWWSMIDDDNGDPATYGRIHIEIHDDSW